MREGFEPSVQFNPYDGLANRSFRPLRHLTETSPLGVAKIIKIPIRYHYHKLSPPHFYPVLILYLVITICELILPTTYLNLKTDESIH